MQLSCTPVDVERRAAVAVLAAAQRPDEQGERGRRESAGGGGFVRIGAGLGQQDTACRLQPRESAVGGNRLLKEARRRSIRRLRCHTGEQLLASCSRHPADIESRNSHAPAACREAAARWPSAHIYISHFLKKYYAPRAIVVNTVGKGDLGSHYSPAMLRLLAVGATATATAAAAYALARRRVARPRVALVASTARQKLLAVAAATGCTVVGCKVLATVTECRPSLLLI